MWAKSRHSPPFTARSGFSARCSARLGRPRPHALWSRSAAPGIPAPRGGPPWFRSFHGSDDGQRRRLGLLPFSLHMGSFRRANIGNFRVSKPLLDIA